MSNHFFFIKSYNNSLQILSQVGIDHNYSLKLSFKGERKSSKAIVKKVANFMKEH